MQIHRTLPVVAILALIMFAGCGGGGGDGAANSPEPVGSWETAEFSQPDQLAAGPSGAVAVAESNQRRVRGFTAEGGLLWDTDTMNDAPMLSVVDVAIGPDGTCYVLCWWDVDESRVYIFDATGSYQRSLVTTAIHSGAALAVTSGGALLITSEDRILEVSQEGAVGVKCGPEIEGTADFQKLDGICVDSAGNIYVADSPGETTSAEGVTDRIVRLNADGEFVTEWGDYGEQEGNFRDPQGLAADAEDNVYVADRLNNRVQVFSSDGDLLFVWEGSGEDGPVDCSPSDVAAGPDGTVYVANWLNDCVDRFTPDLTPTAR